MTTKIPPETCSTPLPEVVAMDSYRDAFEIAVRDSLASAERLRMRFDDMQARRVDRDARLAEYASAGEGAGLSYEDASLDTDATASAVESSRAILARDLPLLAAQLGMLHEGVTSAIEELDDRSALDKLATVLETIVNRRDMMALNKQSDLAVATDLLRGTAYVAENGDYEWFPEPPLNASAL